MSQLRFEQLRIPAALILLIAAAFMFLPRGGHVPEPAGAAPEASIVAGQPGGEVSSSAVSSISPGPTSAATTSPAATASTATATPAATATPEPTPQPVARDGFQAEVLACRSISGSQCRGQLGNLPANAGSFTALVRFTDANAGDAISVNLSGPGGTIAGGPYTLQGSGDGYYYSTFSVGGLPGGDYTLIATRNGTEVAGTTFRRGG